MTRPLVLAAFRRRYGAGPLHLAAHLLGLAIAGFALARILSGGHIADLVVCYAGLIIAHDLVFVPAYTGLDRLARAGLARLPIGRGAGGVPMINHIRAPALISGLLLIIYAPLIAGRNDASHFAMSGQHLDGRYARNWLLISLGLFLGSGVIYGLRWLRTGRPAPASVRATEHAVRRPPPR